MTGRELLELAAKAAGIDLTFDPNGMPRNCTGAHPAMNVFAFPAWNPLENDGDALRLAIKLNFGISIPVHKTIRADVICFLDSSVNIREENGDPYAATRRAIVRAAAEIGKRMESKDE